MSEPVGDELRARATALVAAAVDKGASHLYLDPDRNGLAVKHRVAGRLVVTEEIEDGALIVAAVKSLVGLDPGATGAPQRGTGVVSLPGGRLNVQSVSFPAALGESVTVQLMMARRGLPTMEETGLGPSTAAVLRAALERPQGVVLTTGPSGSGKTTLAFSLLAELVDVERRIMTIEDPVAYEIEGAVQAVVTPDFTTADALRVMAESDVDVVFASEVRTGEEVDLGFQLARAGRRFISVMHAPDAVSALHRLAHHFDLDRALLIEGLNVIVAQRLVRGSCRECRTSRLPTSAEADHLGLDQRDRAAELVVNAGCSSCDGTGAGRRIAAVEVLTPSRAVLTAVIDGAGVPEMRAALGPDFRSIDADIRAKAQAGEISIDVAMAAVAAHIDLTANLNALVRQVETERPRLADIPGTVTIVFTDIVDSTVHTSALGDEVWMRVLREHNEAVRKHIAEWGGSEVKTNGDSFMVAFSSATAAVRCSLAAQDAVARIRLPDGSPLMIRAGMHAGEPVREGDDFFGMAVVVAARVGSAAGGGEVLVTDLVRSLVEPAGFTFGEGRTVELKGLAGSHVLYPVGPSAG